MNQKIDENRNEIESTEMTKLKLQIEKYQTENDILKQQSNNLNNQINNLNENVKNYEKKQQKLQKTADSQKDKLIQALNNQLGNLTIEMNILRNDNMNLTQGIGIKKNGKYLNPKLIDTESPILNLSLEEEKNVYIFTSLCNKTNKGLYNILLDYDKDNDFYLLKPEFISVLDYVQLPFEQRDTVIKVSGFDIYPKLSINHIVSAFFEREENKTIKLNQSLFNIIYKLNITKKTVEDLYKDLSEKCHDKLINSDDLKEILNKYLIREKDIDGLINNWEYKNNQGFFNIEDLTNHLKQRENIINDIIDINNEIKFGEPNMDNKINININDESDNKSKSEYSNSNLNKESINNKKVNENYNKNNEDYINNKNNDNDYINYSHQNSDIILKKTDKEEDKSDKININNQLDKISENNDDNINNHNNNNKIVEYNDNNNEYNNENELDNYNDFDNNIQEKDNNNNNSNLVEESKNEEVDYNNNNYSNLNNENENDIDNEEKSENENEKENNDINNEDNNDENLQKSTSKKKKKKSTSKKKKGKKSKEKLNVNEVINGELKVQVNNIENVMIPKTVYTPCSFSLSCSIEGIDKVLKSREVITDDLRNVVFNWATRVLLKKKTLKDLSCKCNINLSVEQKNKNISLGNCEFEWRKCLLKSNWDKFAINETFQVLTDRKFKKIPMGNIKILAKFIPFGSKNSNYSKFGKKKKTPTNLNGIAEEPSHNSSISVKDNKNVLQEINNDDENNINHNILDINNSNIDNGKIENVNEDENNYHDSEVNKDEINEESKEENQSEFYEENQGKNILKEFDLEITSVDKKELLINKGYYLTISAVEDGEEQEKVSKDKGNLKEILKKLPYTTAFSVYSYKKNNRLKIILYLRDEEDNEVGKLPIILSNKESHLEKTGKYEFKVKDKKYIFFLKITINTVED